MILGGSITLLVGLLLGAIALAQMLRARSDLGLLVATPTTPIALAPHGRVVEILGTVVPGEQGVAVSPASGREVVLHEVEVYDTESSVTLVHSTKDSRHFWVRDERGDHARIVADGAELLVRLVRYTSGALQPNLGVAEIQYAPLTPELRAWTVAVTGAHDRPMMVEAREIAPGDRLLALGYGERGADGTLVLAKRSGQPMVLSDRTEAELREHRRGQQKLGCGFLAVFACVAAVGAALIAAGFLLDP